MDISQEKSEHIEIMKMRRLLKSIRSHEISDIFLLIVASAVFALRLSTFNIGAQIRDVIAWILLGIPVFSIFVQWLTYTFRAKGFYSRKIIDSDFCEDFYKVAVWEPRSFIFIAFLFEALVATTGFLGTDRILAFKYSVFPLCFVGIVSCLRGYIRGKDLAHRLVKRLDFIALQTRNPVNTTGL